ncbi:Protein FAF-like, chloroplastic, partial [Linum grandiflorum]
MERDYVRQKTKEEDKDLSPPYIHPLVRQSKSCYLSEKSLEICTKSLGSETGSEGFSSNPSSVAGDNDEEGEEQSQTKEEENVVSDPPTMHVFLSTMDSLPSSISNKKIYVVVSAGNVQSGHQRCRLSLIGRIFWPLPKPLYALHHDLARQWKLRPQEFHVYEAGHGLLQFVFTAEKAKDMVLANQPWSYKNHILNLIPWEVPSQPVFDRLQYMALTIQLLEVPPHCITTEFGKEILAPVGEVISAAIYTARPNGAGRPLVKVVVRMDLLTSFPGKVEAVVPGEPSFDVLLGYEGISAVCFLCGLLGHNQRSCGHAAIIGPTPGLRGMWMLAKASGYLLEDFGVPAVDPPEQRPKPQRPAKQPLLLTTASASSSSPSIPPLRPVPHPKVPLINELEDMLLVDRKRPRNNFVSSGSSASKKSVLPRSFPPPIPSLARGAAATDTLHMRPHRDNGRLVLEAVCASRNNFRAQREHGRLVMTFVPNESTEQIEKTSDSATAEDQFEVEFENSYPAAKDVEEEMEMDDDDEEEEDGFV